MPMVQTTGRDCVANCALEMEIDPRQNKVVETASESLATLRPLPEPILQSECIVLPPIRLWARQV